MATQQQGQAAPKGATLQLADLPKPWLLSLLCHHLDDIERLALFQTCHTLATAVVENCQCLHVRPHVAAIRNRLSNCAAMSNLAKGCSNIHLQLLGGSLRISAHLAASVTHLTLVDTHLSKETVSHLCMEKMDRLVVLKLEYQEATHRHSSGLDEDALMTALKRDGPWLLSSPVLSLQCNSACKDDVQTTLQRLSPLFGGSVHILEASQVSALRTIGGYPNATSVTVKSNCHSQKLECEDWEQLLWHPALRMLCIPCTQWSSTLPDLSAWSWKLDVLRLLFRCPTSAVLAKLPLRDVKLLLIEGGIDCWDLMHEEMVFNLKRCTKVKFLPTNSLPTWQYVPAGLPVVQLDNCLDKEVVTLVTHDMHDAALTIGMCRRVQLSELQGLAHISTTVSTIELTNWQLDADNGCTWLHVWRSLPAHIRHVVLSQVWIGKRDLMTILNEPRPPALQHFTLAYAYDGGPMQWVHDFTPNIIVAASTKWGYLSPGGVELRLLARATSELESFGPL